MAAGKLMYDIDNKSASLQSKQISDEAIPIRFFYLFYLDSIFEKKVIFGSVCWI